ncbi:bcl-2-like protein 12 [Discoglossus pictus]
MEDTVMHTTDAISLIKVKEETKFVLEAFLKRSLSHEEGKHVGHVGRTYHDPKKFCQRPTQPQHEMGSPKKGKKTDKKKSWKEEEERSQSLHYGEVSVKSKNGTWNSLHEEINRVEETKHGFKTNMKKLLRRHSHAKEKASTPKDRSGSIHNKSRGSIENVLEDLGKGSSKGDTFKRPKSPNPLLACATAVSMEEESPREGVDKHSSHGSPKKHNRAFSLKNIFKKKSSKDPAVDTVSAPVRPNFLPLKPCYDKEPRHNAAKESGKDDDSEIYSLAAVKLEKLVKKKKLKSPVAPSQPVVFFSAAEDADPHLAENNNVAASGSQTAEDKEEVIKKLVALLQEQAVVINEKISKDPFLRNALTRMSYGSFHRLVDVFTNQTDVPVDEVGEAVSPELTKIALTMELTRKVAGISSYPVQTLMGYSMQYMDMFVPWLQKQGGWENIVSHGDIPDFQID